MRQTQKDIQKYRDWRIVVFTGVLGFAVTLVAVEIIDSFSPSLTSLSIAVAAVAGSLVGVCLVGLFSAWRVRQKLSEQNMRLDGALNNMIQGLCMFDAQNRLLVWNEKYRAMYNIDPKRIWRGCTIRDLLDARIAAGTFPLDPSIYDGELRAALKQGMSFTLNIELQDGRIIDVVNQPIEGGGWVAMHEDITERKKAVRELEHTRSFLNMIIENVPSPIIVKDMDLKYLLLNRAAEKTLGIDRSMILGKTAGEVFPKASAEKIELEDRRLIESGQPLYLD
jgi:PAS domain-containing protein